MAENADLAGEHVVTKFEDGEEVPMCINEGRRRRMGRGERWEAMGRD